jgi:hypothetical protein
MQKYGGKALFSIQVNNKFSQRKNLMKVSDNWKVWVISKRNDEFVHHQSKDSHLGSTSVVELDSTLGKLFFFGEGIPSEVNVSVTEITNKFVSSSWNILHEGTFQNSNEGNNLHDSGGWNGIRSKDGGNSVRVGVEGVTSIVDVSWKVDSGASDNLAEESKLADTAVLDFNVSEAFESGLVFSTELSERIEEAKRWLSTKFVLKCHVGGNRGLGLGSWGKGRSRCKERCEDCELHTFLECERKEVNFESCTKAN